MRGLLFLAAGLLVSISPCATGGTCTSGSLASYISLGSAGCTIGTNTLYDFQTVSGTAGATEISTQDITISPLGGNYNPGLTASVSQSASANNESETIFTYRIAGSTYVGDSITLGGSSETGDGGVTDVQNFCAGGTFGVDGLTGCTGSPGSLLTLDGTQNKDSTGFGPVGLVSVTDDFTLDGGLAGSASGGEFTDRFAAVPEPLTYWLTALGLALTIGITIKSGSTAQFKK
jgi:hypothetical protein